ncbi:MAG: BACON domain-containing protein [Bacteroidota bacterium]
MAVPNTTTFTLQDVLTELGLTSPFRTLSDAFVVAIDSRFDPAYKGSKNSLLNFRNYNSGPSSNLTVFPTFLLSSGSSGFEVIDVTSNVSWTVSDNASWLSVSPTSGSNNDTLTVFLQANSGGVRNATITVTGGGITRTCSITQEGSGF